MSRRIVLCALVLAAAAASVAVASSQAEAPQAGAQRIVDLKFLAGTDKFDPETDFTRQLIKERLGYNIIPEMGTEDDKVNLIVSSGQEYDAIRFSNRNLLSSFIENQAIHDLTDHIARYGGNLKKYLPKELWDMVSSQGRIYAIPTEAEGVVDWGTMIRADWLKALGLPMPGTPAELRAALVAFKQKNPGQVPADKLIPLTVNGAQMTSLQFNGVAQAFGIGKSPISFVERGGSIVNSLETEGVKEFLAYLADLYTQGLLDADFPANTGQITDKKVGGGLVGAVYNSVWSTAGAQTLIKASPGAALEYLPPLADRSGARRIERLSGLKQVVIVPRASKKAAEVVKFANAFLEPANYTALVVGQPGVHHEVRDGRYYPLFPAFDQLNKGRWFYPANSAELYVPLFAARAHKEERMGYQFDKLNEYLKYAYDDIYMYAPNVPELQKYGQPLTAFAEENLIKMVIDAGARAGFDKFVAQWKSRGGDELTAALNRWYKSRQ